MKIVDVIYVTPTALSVTHSIVMPMRAGALQTSECKTHRGTRRWRERWAEKNRVVDGDGDDVEYKFSLSSVCIPSRILSLVQSVALRTQRTKWMLNSEFILFILFTILFTICISMTFHCHFFSTIVCVRHSVTFVGWTVTPQNGSGTDECLRSTPHTGAHATTGELFVFGEKISVHLVAIFSLMNHLPDELNETTSVLRISCNANNQQYKDKQKIFADNKNKNKNQLLQTQWHTERADRADVRGWAVQCHAECRVCVATK